MTIDDVVRLVVGIGAIVLAMVAQYGWVRQARERERLRCEILLLDAGLLGRLDAAAAIAAVNVLKSEGEGGGR